MALNSQYAVAQRNALLDLLAAQCNSGYLRIYSGTQPATADTAITSQTLLAELRFAATAFGAAASGTATAAAIATVAASATGTAAWCRLLESDGTTVVCDGSAGTASANVVLNSVAIQQGADVSVSSLTLSLAASGS